MKENKILQSRIKQLEEQLALSAFRQGTSALRYGLISQAPSDHLPISALVHRSQAAALNLMSWNLLADAHLYNNFMNVSGTQLLKETILQSGQANIYCSDSQDMLYHFFSELAQFLYKNKDKSAEKIEVNEELLKKFVQLENQPCKLTRSRNPSSVVEKELLAVRSREQIINFFVDQSHCHAEEFQLAIRHSVEFIHHITGDGGVLQWKNRFKHIEANIPLQLRMQRMDFICLQECTKPDNLLDLLNQSDGRYQMLSFSIDAHCPDHCAILFDAQKYVLDRQVNYAIEGKKPALFARFYPKGKPDQAFIVASIHYPGGEHRLMPMLLEQIKSLDNTADKSLDYFMLGDYNHPEDFFQDTSSEAVMIFPQVGTMAGNDYGNMNQAIDGLCTNLDKEAVEMQRINEMPDACPAFAELKVCFDFAVKPGLLNQSSSRFFQKKRVETVVDPLVAFQAAQLMESSSPQLVAPVALFSHGEN